MNLQPVGNSILFQFNDSISNKTFDNNTPWGFTIKNKVTDVKQPRWGKVIAVGSHVYDASIINAKYILIEALAWTNGHEFRGETIWRTDVSKVLATSNAAHTLMD